VILLKFYIHNLLYIQYNDDIPDEIAEEDFRADIAGGLPSSFSFSVSRNVKVSKRSFIIICGVD
jgi:hypothetical protein